jgi:hypothetical protein
MITLLYLNINQLQLLSLLLMQNRNTLITYISFLMTTLELVTLIG